MMPESAASNQLELYRASRFPDEWELHSVMLADTSARDATIHRDRSGYWLFATISGSGGGAHDELFVFTSDSLAGPWAHHPRNPVISDVRWARPAGGLFEHHGRLIRPAQDCSERYGGAVVFREITTLDRRHYRERTLVEQAADWAPGLRATHTYNRGGGWEVLDGCRAVRSRR